MLYVTEERREYNNRKEKRKLEEEFRGTKTGSLKESILSLID